MNPPRVHRALLASLLLVLVWTLEVWFAQDALLVPTFKVPEALIQRQLLRLGMNVGVIVVAIYVLPRRALYAFFGAQLVLFILGGIYYDHYGRLPKIAMFATHGGEGAAIWPMIVGMVAPGRVALFGGLFAVKCALARLAKDPERPPVTRKVVWGGVALWVIMFVVANVTLDPLTKMKRWGTASRYGLTYGFTIPMVVEAYYATNSSFRERALASARASTDRLTPLEPDFPVHDRVVFLQVESLDWGVMDRRVGGVPVTPRLNALKERSLYYKAEAAHFTGSADSDFVALMGVWPSKDICTYKIDDYPFGTALPHTLNQRGFSTASIHGVSGAFFNRRFGFGQMGVSNLMFQEELTASGVEARHAKYNWIQDGELFDFAAGAISKAEGKTFHLVITVTSHSPFKELPKDERSSCANWDDLLDRYFCSMGYVDRGVGRYLDRLPKDTTLVVYGDHNSSISAEGYDSGRRGDRDWVPVMVYNHGEDLSGLQRTRDGVALDGSLTFVDVMRYVHAQILRAHPPVAAAAP